jgi:hypothetical protein
MSPRKNYDLNLRPTGDLGASLGSSRSQFISMGRKFAKLHSITVGRRACEVCSIQYRTGKFRTLEGSVENRIPKISPTKVGAFQIAATKARVLQLAVSKIGAKKPSSIEDSSLKIRTRKIEVVLQVNVNEFACATTVLCNQLRDSHRAIAIIHRF